MAPQSHLLNFFDFSNVTKMHAMLSKTKYVTSNIIILLNNILEE